MKKLIKITVNTDNHPKSIKTDRIRVLFFLTVLTFSK